MKIGTEEIKICNQCPAYKWSGESTSQGDAGFRCGFGVFSSCFDEEKQIPKECPWRVMRDEIKSLRDELKKNKGE